MNKFYTPILFLLIVIALISCRNTSCEDLIQVNAYLYKVKIINSKVNSNGYPAVNPSPLIKYQYNFYTKGRKIKGKKIVEINSEKELLQYLNYKKGDSILINYCRTNLYVNDFSWDQ